MPFVRVKSAVVSDPQHEFDVAIVEVEANPDIYVVVDDVPSDECRPPSYVEPVVPDPVPVVKNKK